MIAVADYSVAQLKAALAGAGFSGTALDVMTAIGLAENTSRVSTEDSPPNNDGSIDRGPVQINSRAHPDVSDACAFDLNCSAAAAFRISDGGTNFKPWSTYGSKAYMQHLTEAITAPTDTGVVGNLVSSVSDLPIVGGAIDSVVDAVRTSLIGAAFVAGGIGLIVAGFWRAAAPARARLKAQGNEAAQAGATAAMVMA